MKKKTKKEEFIESWKNYINQIKDLTLCADNKEQRNEIYEYVNKGLELVNKFADNAYGTDGNSTRNNLTNEVQEFNDVAEFQNQEN